VCTSNAERWRIGRPMTNIYAAGRTVHTAFRRRLPADRSATTASEPAYSWFSASASVVTRRTNMTYKRRLLRDERFVVVFVRARASACVRSTSNETRPTAPFSLHVVAVSRPHLLRPRVQHMPYYDYNKVL
jgi:hypothetical protein